jgi:hypothetical protein
MEPAACCRDPYLDLIVYPLTLHDGNARAIAREA